MGDSRPLPRRRGPWTAVACCGAALLGLSAAVGTAVPAAAGAPGARTVVAPAGRVGMAPRLPRGARVLGAFPATRQIHVDVVLKPRDPAALARLAAAVSTPGSPMYRHFLPRGAFAARFGPAPAAVASVLGALRAAGLTPAGVSPDHLIVHVTAAAGALAKAFSIGFEQVRVGGRVAFANTAAPRLGGAALPYVLGVVGLNDLVVPHPMLVRSRHGAARHAAAAQAVAAAGPTACVSASSLTSGTGPYTSDQLARAYSFSNLYSGGDLGAGVGVAIVELEPVSTVTDIPTFESCYGVSTPVHTVPVDGGADTAQSGEAALDVEDVIGLAPGVSISVYEGPNGSSDNGFQSLLDIYSKIVSSDTQKVVTTSWGACEADVLAADPSLLQSEDSLFQEAAVDGQSVFAASGDLGSEDCDNSLDRDYQDLYVDDPAGDPNVTAVGGTTLPNPTTSAVQHVWNTATGAGGGGTSIDWPMGSAQLNAPAALGVLNGTYSYCPSSCMREVPDVSSDADPATGLVIYYSGNMNGAPFGGWGAIGGTSIAAPLWAAATALVDDYGSCAGTKGLGLLSDSLYQLAGRDYGGTFSDIAGTGAGDNNDFSGANFGWYPTYSGYDMATGLGTPVVSGIASQLCFSAPSAPASVSVSGAAGSSTPGSSAVKVSWTAPASSGGGTITGYVITPSPACAGCQGLATGGSTLTTTVVGLVPAQSYTFSVAAENAAGPGPSVTSASVVAPATAPSAPGAVAASAGSTATAGNGQVLLSWNAPADNGSAISGYTVTPSPPCGGCGGLHPAGAPATVSGLTPGTSYTFSIAATNSIGTGPAGSSAAIVPLTVPGAPTSVVASAGPAGPPGDGEIDLAWSAPAQSGGTTITAYTVTPSPACPSCGGLSPSGAAQSTTVTGLVPGTPYTFSVTAANAVGRGGAGTSNSFTAPATAPSAPTGVTAGAGPGSTPGDGQVQLSWTAPPSNGSGIVRYTVSATPACASCGGLSPGLATSTTVTGLTPGQPYTFSVTATNGVGTGPAGTSGSQTPLTVPGAPTAVTASAGPVGPPGSSEIHLTWSAPAQTGGTTITAYTVTASPACPSCGGLSPSGATPSTTVTGLVPGTLYTFSVTATNSVGRGAAATSSSFAAPATAPGGPGAVSAAAGPHDVAGDGEAVVSWSAPAANGSAITGYTIAPSPSCAACGGLTATGTSTSTTVTGLTPGHPYTFTVTATNGVGAGTPASSAAFTPTTVPFAPGSVTACTVGTAAGDCAGTGQILVSWAAAVANGSPITAYSVTSPQCASCKWSGGTGTSSSVSGLTPGQSYTFTVTATNADGTSAGAASNAAVAPSAAPAAPGSLTIAPGSVATPGDGQATLSWAAPAANGSKITGYTVSVAPPCTGCHGLGAGAATVSRAVSGLVPGKAYTFSVTATNAIGTGPAGTSRSWSVFTVPSAPAIVGAPKVAGGGVVVTVKAPAVSGGEPLAGYVVVPSPACAACHSTTTSGSSVNVTGLRPGTTYRFTVRALNKAGAGPASTASSAVLFPLLDGYWLASRDGVVSALGAAPALSGTRTSAADPVVGITSTPDGRGIFVATADGTVTVAGDARSHGDLPEERVVRSDIVSIVATLDGGGYWLLGADGEVYAFGDAPFHGDLLSLPKPVLVSNIVGMVACAGDAGYLLIGSDGGVFAFGHTHFYGSLPGAGVAVNDIRGILPSATNKGYVLVGADGGAFVFGTGTRFFGSLPGRGIRVNDVVGLAITPDGGGYYMAGSNGTVYGFGDARVFAEPKSVLANLPVAAIAGV